jgi:hypothetical protein
LNGQVTTTNGSWSNTEDKLTLIIDYQAVECDIKEYSKTKMSIESFYSETYNGVVSTSLMVMVLEKK